MKDSTPAHGPRQPPTAEAMGPIDWDNVAVEAAVMLRLQDAGPNAAGRAPRPESQARD
jgi:hypothetical protein